MLDTYQPGEFMTWEVHDIVQETEIKTIPKKKKCKKVKWLSEKALQIAVNKREDSTQRYHQMVNTKIRLMIFFAAKDGKLDTVSKTRSGAECGSDHEHLIAKFRLKLKKVGKQLDHLGMT